MLIKAVKKSLIIAAVIAAVCNGANLIKYALTSDIFGVEYWGGEIMTKSFFGLVLDHFYPLTTADAYTGPNIRLGFDIVSFLIWFLAVFAAVLVIALIAGLIARKNASE